MTLAGYNVLDIQPDFASPPMVRANLLYDRVDMAMANTVLSYRGKHPQHVFHFDFREQGTTAIRALEDFFYGQAGKWAPFWVPSWHAELEPAADLLNTGTSLSINPVSYGAIYGPDTTNVTRLGNYIFLYNQDGTLWLPQVTGVTGTSPEVLALGEAASQDWIVGEFFVGFLYFVRFLNDDMEMAYEGPGVATTTLGMMEVVGVESDADNMGDPEIPGIAFYDEFDSYAVGQTDNLNRGWAWGQSWQPDARTTGGHDEVLYDDLSTYTSGTGVNGTAMDGDGADGNFVAG